MDIRLPNLLEWQKQLFAKIEAALAAGERTFLCNVGRQAGKSTALLEWALVWERGVLHGGHIAICAPSTKHLEDLKDKVRRWLGELVTPSPAGIGLDVAMTNGRVDFWPCGYGAVAVGRGRTYEAICLDETSYIPNLEALLQENLEPTLSTTGGPVISFATPAGTGNSYHALWKKTPAIARFSGGSDLNPLVTAEWLAQKRRKTFELRYLQEYEAVFTTQLGTLLKRDKVRFCQPPPLESFKTISLACDPAISQKSGADFTGFCVSGVAQDDKRYVLHLAHWRLPWVETEAKLIGLWHAWRRSDGRFPDVMAFEAVGFASLGCRALLGAGVACRPIVPHRDKRTRFERLLVRFYTSDIVFSDNLDEECLNELFGFGFDEDGKDLTSHDDVVDSVEMSLTPLFPELSDDWSGDQTSGRHWGHRLPHEIEPAKIHSSDGSFVQLCVGENGKEEFTTFNADGTKRVDDGRRIEKIGDEAILFDRDGNELDRCGWNAHVWGSALVPPPKSP